MLKVRKRDPTPPPPPRIFGYLRVTTIDQDLEKNKADILGFARVRGRATVNPLQPKIEM